jgi:PAS domain S-box-containing protein
MFVVSVGTAMAMLWTVGVVETQRREAEFGRAADDIANVLQARIDDYLSTLEATHALFMADAPVDFGLFHRFVRPIIDDQHGLMAVEWVRRVSANDREAHEREARRDAPGYRIWERAADGTPVAAGDRVEYFPVHYVAPVARNVDVVGFDFGSDATRSAAVTASRDTGRVTVVRPLTLMQAPDDSFGYLVCLPIYWDDDVPAQIDARREKFRGVVVGVFGARRLHAISAARASEIGLEVELRDGDQVIASGSTRASTVGSHSREFVPPFVSEAPIALGDHVLTLVVRPTSDYALSRASPLFLAIVGGAGLLATAVLLYFVLLHRQFAEQAELADALSQSEERYRTLVENAPEGLVVLDPEIGRFVDANGNALRLFKLDRRRLLEKGPAELSPRIQPDGRESRAAVREAIARAGRGETVVFPWVHVDAEGAAFPCEVRLTRLPAGDRALIVGSIVDTSERRRSEMRQLMMARELDHRVKNVLATVVAVAEQAGATVHSYAEFQSTFAARVRAMARVHEALSASHWEGVELRTIVKLTLAPYVGPHMPRIELRGPVVLLGAAASSALSLAFHELAANAAKHGALSGTDGTVAVEWSVATDGSLLIEWHERGGPPGAGPPERSGFGLRLLHGLITHELGGRLWLEHGGEGMICRMTLPAEHRVTGGEPE